MSANFFRARLLGAPKQDHVCQKGTQLCLPASGLSHTIPRLPTTDSHFKRTRLSVEEPVGRGKRRFAAATGCSARLWWHLRAGANAEMAARGQAGGGRHEPARRRTRVSGGGCDYQRRRWSNSKAGLGWIT